MSLLRKLKKLLRGVSGPEMVNGYKRYDGAYLKYTRISDSTYVGNPEKLDISDHVFIGHFNFIDASNGLTIGEGCQITNYISILTHSSHSAIRLYGKEYVNTKKPVAYNRAPVAIGNYCFIGPHSTIMPDTTIGKGSLIAAYSYVKGEFPEFSIIAGNPAKVVGDTREMDKKHLEKHPELQDLYKAWTQ